MRKSTHTPDDYTAGKTRVQEIHNDVAIHLCGFDQDPIERGREPPKKQRFDLNLTKKMKTQTLPAYRNDPNRR